MHDTSKLFFPLVATSAAVAVGSLALLKTDVVSRKILDPAQLNTKRRIEYRYSWEKAEEEAKLQLDNCLAGGPRKYNDEPGIHIKNTEYISDEDDLNVFVTKVTDKKETQSKFYVVKVDKDPHDPTEEFYMLIVQEQNSGNYNALFRVPLIRFGMKLAEAFENQLTSTTLCFVADASAGKASKMLESLLKESRAGVAVVSEPFWMIQISKLAESSILTSAKIRKLVFALCRLDAMSVRHEVGYAKTVVFTLPGQALVATLLPLVQSVFPEERHVFTYDGCVASVQRGIYAELMYRRSEHNHDLKNIIRGMCKDPVQVTTPFPSNTPLSYDASLGGRGGPLEMALAQVPLKHARNVEAWISSVDAFSKLKNEETNNGYLPFCLKLGFLTGDSVGNFEHGTDSYWSLKSVMQYVTGCQGRAISEEVFDAAKEWLKDYNDSQEIEQKRIENIVNLSECDRNRIENCCFQHKQILIGNKTLQDTVLPKEHWTMKQTSRNGCSCCGPDPYEQMEEDEAKSGSTLTSIASDNINETTDTNRPSRSFVSNRTNGYVDATQVFAFDPIRFS